MPRSWPYKALENRARHQAAPPPARAPAVQECDCSQPAQTPPPPEPKRRTSRTIEMPISWSLILALFLAIFKDVNCGPNSEWKRSKLRRPHLDMKVDDKSCDETEGNLRDDKPPPVDPLIQNRADDPKRRTEDASPQKRRNKAGSQNRSLRIHRQHRTVEQSDQHRSKRMDRRSGQQTPQMKLRQKLVALACPADKAARSQQVRRIPHAVIAEETVQRSRHNHRHPARNPALHSRHHAERLDWQ